MARMARVVVPGGWHHVTQRGNRQAAVFLADADRRFYLELLKRYAVRFRVRIAGYCLMGNHVHLVASPAGPEGLAKALGRTHNDYARWCNLKRNETGHVWQNRFFSCPLDEPHTWQALQYVERNPVRAGLVARAQDWPWSSAAAHVSGTDPTGLLDLADWRLRWSPANWHDVLQHGVEDAALLERMREATRTGRPMGGERFLVQAEAATGRLLAPQKRGRRPKPSLEPAQWKLGIA